ERFRLHGAGAREAWVHAVRRPGDGDEVVTIDIAIYGEDLRLAGAIEGLSLKVVPREALLPQNMSAPDWHYEMRWAGRPPPSDAAAQPAAPGAWLILADRGGVGAAIATVLRRARATCRLVRLDDLANAAGPRDTKALAASVATALTGFATRCKAPLR